VDVVPGRQQHQIIVTGDVPIEIHTDYFGNKVGTFTYSKTSP